MAGSCDLRVVVEAGGDLGLQFGKLGGSGRGVLDAGLLKLTSQPRPTFGDGTTFGFGGVDALLKVLCLGTTEFQSGSSGQVVFVDCGVEVTFGAVGGDFEFDDLPGQRRKVGAEDIELAPLLVRQQSFAERDRLRGDVVGSLETGGGFAQLQQMIALFAQFDDMVMSVLEVTELCDGSLGEVEGHRTFEHMVSEEPVEAVQALRRLCLVQQLECGLVGHAEGLAHPCIELPVVAVRGDHRIRMVGLEFAGLESGARIVLQVGEVEVRALEDTSVGEVRRFRARTLDEEESGQRQGLVAAVVVAEDDSAPGGARAQIFADDPVLFGIRGASPGPADVADEAALVEASARGLSSDVEAQPLVRGEDCGDSVEEGGLARARGPGDEVALVGDGDAVDVGVEGAPVRDLDLAQAPLTADVGPVRSASTRLVGDEGGIEREECLGHASSSSVSASMSLSASDASVAVLSTTASAMESPPSSDLPSWISTASVSPAAMRS